VCQSSLSFRQDGVEVCRHALNVATLDVVREYCRFKRQLFKPVFGDSLCPDAYSVYSDVLAESFSSRHKTNSKMLPVSDWFRHFHTCVCTDEDVLLRLTSTDRRAR